MIVSHWYASFPAELSRATLLKRIKSDEKLTRVQKYSNAIKFFRTVRVKTLRRLPCSLIKRLLLSTRLKSYVCSCTKRVRCFHLNRFFFVFLNVLNFF